MLDYPKIDRHELGAFENADAAAWRGNPFVRALTNKLLIFAAVFSCALAPGGGAHAQQGRMPDFHPLVPIQHEDYVRARSHFHTKLLRLGPSPQSFDPISPPSGVSEVTYSPGAESMAFPP